jgi:hypothetical protein
VETIEEEGRSGSTAETLTVTATVHSAEEGTVLAAEAASVQREVTVRPVQGTDEVRPPIEGEEPVMETIGTPTKQHRPPHQCRLEPNGRKNEWSLK